MPREMRHRRAIRTGGGAVQALQLLPVEFRFILTPLATTCECSVQLPLPFAALMLGAQGALIGTTFCTATEALDHKSDKERILVAKGRDTERTRVFDIIR